MSRTRCTVNRFDCTPFFTTLERPFCFLDAARIKIWLTRTYQDGIKQEILLEVLLRRGYMTDGASTFWPITKLVPQWRHGDDRYNAGPVTHDVLYLLEGIVRKADGGTVKLSREEVDDIIRGMWRCWGMSRFLAGCADKGLELFAGGKSHWGNDSYMVRDRVAVRWTELGEIERADSGGTG